MFSLNQTLKKFDRIEIYRAESWEITNFLRILFISPLTTSGLFHYRTIESRDPRSSGLITMFVLTGTIIFLTSGSMPAIGNYMYLFLYMIITLNHWLPDSFAGYIKYLVHRKKVSFDLSPAIALMCGVSYAQIPFYRPYIAHVNFMDELQKELDGCNYAYIHLNVRNLKKFYTVVHSHPDNNLSMILNINSFIDPAKFAKLKDKYTPRIFFDSEEDLAMFLLKTKLSTKFSEGINIL